VGRKSVKGVTVGLIHNVKRVKPKQTDGEWGDDADAEYDAPETINAIAEAIEAEGHRVVKLEATPDLLAALPSAGIDVAFNIAEGQKGRGRESWVPAVLDLLGVPYTGSDATTMAITLDKGLAKRVVRSAGVSTPQFFVIDSLDTPIPAHLKYPVIVKPVAEGSSKGVTQKSVARDATELRAVVTDLITRYGQGAMVEGFLTGREFTVGLLGERRILPPMEIVFSADPSTLPVYGFEHKQAFTDDVKYVCPAQMTPALDRALRKAARDAFVALGCRDVARIDLRLDGDGVVNFIECNPLPGLTPDWSDLCLIAKAANLDYRGLVAAILRPALRRLRAQRQAATGRVGRARAAAPDAAVAAAAGKQGPKVDVN
jgi:D-alanine-D-alanine ligase